MVTIDYYISTLTLILIYRHLIKYVVTRLIVKRSIFLKRDDSTTDEKSGAITRRTPSKESTRWQLSVR